jgi:hypothetical protein
LTELKLLLALEILSIATALVGLVISARFTLRMHHLLRTYDTTDKRYVPALTRRRTNATMFFVQLTLLVACCYRLAHPMTGVILPSAMRLVMAAAIIRTCMLNERDRRNAQLVFVI